MGVKFVYVLPFLVAKRETHKRNSQEISGECQPGTVPGQSQENPGKIPGNSGLCLLAFSGPIKMLKPQWHFSPLQGQTPDWPVSLVLPVFMYMILRHVQFFRSQAGIGKSGIPENWRKNRPKKGRVESTVRKLGAL